MADAFSVNENPATKTGLYLIWRLTRVLIAAGATVSRSSDGTTQDATDRWTTYGGLGNGSWIVLNWTGGRQLCFWRNTAGGTNSGRIIYARSGGFTYASVTATNPGTLPATAQYVRGDGATFVAWCGTTTEPTGYFHVGAKDISDGSFYAIATGPTLNRVGHALVFASIASFDVGDVDPFVWCTPGATAISNSIATTAAETMMLNGTAENAAGTNSTWWGWARNTNWKPFDYAVLYTPNNANTRLGGTTNDVNPYTGGNPVILEPLFICKIAETAFRERKGYLKHFRISPTGAGVLGDTYNTRAWCILNTASAGNAAFFWDGVTALALT